MTTTPNPAAETNKPAIAPAPDDGHKQDNSPTPPPTPPEAKK